MLFARENQPQNENNGTENKRQGGGHLECFEGFLIKKSGAGRNGGDQKKRKEKEAGFFNSKNNFISQLIFNHFDDSAKNNSNMKMLEAEEKMRKKFGRMKKSRKKENTFNGISGIQKIKHGKPGPADPAEPQPGAGGKRAGKAQGKANVPEPAAFECACRVREKEFFRR